jgi:outer membrane protein assembly factor BamB
MCSRFYALAFIALDDARETLRSRDFGLAPRVARCEVERDVPTSDRCAHGAARRRRIVVNLARLAALCAVVALPQTALPGEMGADSWSQLWGPSGNGMASASARLAPAVRLREVWRRPVGSGFSALSTAGTRGYTGLSDGPSDFLAAIDLASGREVWRTRLGDAYRGHDGSKDGPISTPTVEGSRVFIVGPRGVLLAADAATGRELWRVDLATDLAAPAPFYGFGTSPLVAGNLVVVAAGGEKHNLAAFAKESGQRVWSVSHSKAVNYATPALATLAGVRQILVLANDLLLGVKPEDGSLLWSQATGWTEEASRAPVVLPGDRVLITGWSEAKLFQVKSEGGKLSASELWKTPRIKNSYSPTVFHEGLIYGMNRDYLTCIDPATGEAVWRHKVYGGSLILVDGHAVILGDSSGDLRVGRLTRQGFEEKAKQPVFNAGATSSTGPSFQGKRIYLRNVEEMVALDVEGS